MAYDGAALLGTHESIQTVNRLIQRIAPSAARSVLIYGETGTGKGLVARLIHDASRRAKAHFVDLNCAAIPGTLLESELFGYEKGAFTGASMRKRGLIEIGNNGTVFLDEIREMDLSTQAKLLSLLDTQRFRPVGSLHTVEVDVRFITASNKVLISEVESGRFREDLYYRLLVVSINLPPLRERGEDVLILADHFIQRFSKVHGRTIHGMEPAVEEIFRTYRWPGNVRELENLIERIFLLEDGDTILVGHIPARIMRAVDETGGFKLGTWRRREQAPLSTAAKPIAVNFHAETRALQKRLIEDALADSKGQVKLAASRLGLSRHALRHYCKKLGVRFEARNGHATRPQSAAM